MDENMETMYGKSHINALPFTTGKTFVVVGSASANKSLISAVFQNDNAGIQRVHTSFTLALAQCVAGRGDAIILAPDFVTLPTAAELLSAETKGVSIIPAGVSQIAPGVFRTYRATAALPQSTSSAIFTVTGRIKLISIVGQVTTVIQTQLDNTKLIGVPTVGSNVDLCAVKDITGAAVGTELSITGTLATAMVQSVGAYVYQAAPLTILAGSINLSCSASNTGSVKWMIDWAPIDPGATVAAA